MSEFSRNELEKYYGIPKEKIIVTYNGIDHISSIDEDNRILDTNKIRDTDYILAVSSLNPSKNFGLIIDVAKVLSVNPRENHEMIRLGLLHDIGKIKYPLNPIEKSIIVLLDKLTKGKIQRMTSLKIVKCYYEHAEIGYELLKALAQYDETFLERVRRHHSQGKGDEVLECLKNADDLC